MVKKLDKVLAMLSGLIILSGFLLRLGIINNLEIEKDEVNFFQAALRFSFKNIFFNSGDYWLKDHPGLFIAIERAVIIFFTTNINFIRLINIVCFIISIVFLYKIASFYAKGANRLILPALFSGSVFFTNINIYANPYSLALCFTLISLYFFLKILIQKAKIFDIFLFSIFFSLFLYTSYAAFLFLACLLPFLLLKLFKKEITIGKLTKIFALITFFSFLQISLFFINISVLHHLAPIYQIPVLDVFKKIALNNIYLPTLPNTYFDYLKYLLFGVIVFLSLFLTIKKKGKLSLSLLLYLILIFVPIVIMFCLAQLLGYALTPKLFFICSIGLISIIFLLFITYKNSLLKLAIIIYFFLILSNMIIQLKSLGSINITHNKKLAQKLINSCDNKSFYIINSLNYDFYPLVYYYLWRYDEGKRFLSSSHQKSSNCVYTNMVIFDNGVGKLHFSNKGKQDLYSIKDLENKNKLIFVFLTEKISNQDLKEIIDMCKIKNCTYER